jgi:hypothetical protein
MAARKRSLEDTSSSRKVKKLKSESEKNISKPQSSEPSSIVIEEVDFPRGGGTSFTPLEVKAFRAEAVKEANAELFKVCFLLCQRCVLSKIYRTPVLKKPKRKGKRQRMINPHRCVLMEERIGFE